MGGYMYIRDLARTSILVKPQFYMENELMNTSDIKNPPMCINIGKLVDNVEAHQTFRCPSLRTIINVGNSLSQRGSIYGITG